MVSPQGGRNRRSLRLLGYDYSRSGAYFLTLCVHNRECLFGDVVNSEILLSRFGEIARKKWLRSSELRSEISLDVFVIMPNHLHGIVFIDPDHRCCATEIERAGVGAHGRAPLQGRTRLPQRPKRSLGSFVAGFKSIVTKCVNEIRETPGSPLWQRNYFDHIIRTPRALNQIREYILTNQRQWHLDVENPFRVESNEIDATRGDPF
jgi:putative transposase